MVFGVVFPILVLLICCVVPIVVKSVIIVIEEVSWNTVSVVVLIWVMFWIIIGLAIEEEEEKANFDEASVVGKSSVVPNFVEEGSSVVSWGPRLIVVVIIVVVVGIGTWGRLHESIHRIWKKNLSENVVCFITIKNS